MSEDWRNGLQIALATRPRVVLTGNIYDSVFDHGRREAIPFSEYLVSVLRRRGYPRICSYDHGDMAPYRHRWHDRDSEGGLQECPPSAPDSRATQEPSASYGELRGQLEQSEVACALILIHAEKRVAYPSPIAVALHQLASLQGDGAALPPEPRADADRSAPLDEKVPRLGVRADDELPRLPHRLLLLYPQERDVPRDLLMADPDTAVIQVPPPLHSDRESYFETLLSQPDCPAVLRASAAELANALEGFRLSEIEQLVELAKCLPREPQLGQVSTVKELIALLRSGRRVDYWQAKRVYDIVRALNERIRGQSDALEQVERALFTAKHRLVDVLDPNNPKPRLVLFVVGPTGVGKTLLARVLADQIAGDNFFRFDMTEYQDRHEGQRFTGPPPGYVGFEEGGQLTNAVRSRPHCVVLLDEIEKAHPLVLDKLLQVLDSARLTDGRGVTVDFSNVSLIFTSNLGHETSSGVQGQDYPKVAEHFLREVREHFIEQLGRPELLGRLTGNIVVFNYISEAVAKQEIGRQLDKLQEEMNSRAPADSGIVIDKDGVRDGIYGWVVELQLGLRVVNKLLEQHVMSELGRFLELGGGPWRCWWNEGERTGEADKC